MCALVTDQLHRNRELWLAQGVYQLRELFHEGGFPLPERIRVACSWPVGNHRKVIGQAWATEVSGDGTHEVLVSPRLAEPVEVLDVLMHELAHCAAGIDQGHQGKFRAVIQAVGLTKNKPTSASAGEKLRAQLEAVALALGPYPHAAVTPGSKKKKQTTRMIKVACAVKGCGYVQRVTRKWLDDPRYGAGWCPAHGVPLRPERNCAVCNALHADPVTLRCKDHPVERMLEEGLHAQHRLELKARATGAMKGLAVTLKALDNPEGEE